METFRCALALAAIAITLAPSLVRAGQTTGTATGTIAGSVRDATGAALPAVTITLTGEALMGARTAATTADGQYRFAALPPGPYRLTFALTGFATRESEVRVMVGFTATVDVAMPIATQREEVVVPGSRRMLDRQFATLAETFDARQLANLPGSRSIGGLLATAHAVQLSPLDFGTATGILAGPQTAYGRSNSPHCPR